MQSVVKLSQVSNVYKLNDVAHGDEVYHAGQETEISKKSARDGYTNSESGSLTPSRMPKNPDRTMGNVAGDAEFESEDTLSWLKVIQSPSEDPTSGFDKDLSASSTERHADDGSRRLLSSSARRHLTDRVGNDTTDQDDSSEERKLAHRLSYKGAHRPPSKPSISQRSVLIPYVVATGIVAFLAGSAMVYFLVVSSSGRVEKRAVSMPDNPIEIGQDRSEQSVTKPGAGRAEERDAEPATSPAFGSRDWSDTVATFKQLVKPAQK